MSAPLRVANLVVAGSGSGVTIVDDVSFELSAGQVLGLVGESGSGKTTLGLALLGYARSGTHIASGHVTIGDKEVNSSSTNVRGKLITYIPQSPASALNPVLRLQTQLLECVAEGERNPDSIVAKVLTEVALPNDEQFLRRYPHQLSGGQQQRIAIAMAFIARPDVIVLDEPTTGLDVTTQRQVLETIRKLVREHQVSAIYISHDVAVVAELVDKVMVLYSGKVVEYGKASEVFALPQHPYARRLIAAVPDLAGKRSPIGILGGAPSPFARPSGCAFHPRCDIAILECQIQIPELSEPYPDHFVRCPRTAIAPPALAAEKMAPANHDSSIVLSVRGVSVAYGKRTVLKDVDLDLVSGQCTALLGESGSGKTTLARSIAGLQPRGSGTVFFDGANLAPGVRERTKEQLRKIQYIFQNPYESINPRRTIQETLIASYQFLCGKPKNGNELVAQALDSVSLRRETAFRYPDQLSGGERQRVAIARALIVNPEILICDEITSSLDVSVQASIIELLQKLQRERKLALLFVTHNIALVRHVAQDVAILESGNVVERESMSHIFASPKHPYTKRLITDAPSFGAIIGAEK